MAIRNADEQLESMFNQMEDQLMTIETCLLYTSDAADDTPCVDLGGRRIIKKSNFNFFLLIDF